MRIVFRKKGTDGEENTHAQTAAMDPEMARRMDREEMVD